MEVQHSEYSMKKLGFLLVIIILSGTCGLYAQTYDEAHRAGVKAFNARDYKTAIAKFKQAVQLNGRKEITWYYTGMSFANMKQYAQSIIAFKKITSINPNYNPYYLLEMGRVYLAMNNFGAAQQTLENFLKRYPNTSKSTRNRHLAKTMLEYATKSPELRAKGNTMSAPVVLRQVNSQFNDYTPRVNPKGDRLYFTSVRMGGFDYLADSSDRSNWGEDVYVSNFVNNQWQEPELLPEPINSLKADFGSAFTGDGQQMVYVRCLGEESVGKLRSLCHLLVWHDLDRTR